MKKNDIIIQFTRQKRVRRYYNVNLLECFTFLLHPRPFSFFFVLLLRARSGVCPCGVFPTRRPYAGRPRTWQNFGSHKIGDMVRMATPWGATPWWGFPPVLLLPPIFIWFWSYFLVSMNSSIMCCCCCCWNMAWLRFFQRPRSQYQVGNQSGL